MNMADSKKYIQSEKSKRQIIEATIHLMATKGYGQTSIADISYATGLTKGALYHHFYNKDELFEVTIRHIGDVFSKKLLELESTQNSSVYQLAQLFDLFVDLFEENSHYILIVCSLVLEMESDRRSFAKPITDMFVDLSTFIERIIGKGQASKEIVSEFDTKLLSLNILGLLFGNTIPWVLNKDKTNYRVIMESQREILLRSISMDKEI